MPDGRLFEGDRSLMVGDLRTEATIARAQSDDTALEAAQAIRGGSRDCDSYSVTPKSDGSILNGLSPAGPIRYPPVNLPTRNSWHTNLPR